MDNQQNSDAIPTSKIKEHPWIWHAVNNPWAIYTPMAGAVIVSVLAFFLYLAVNVFSQRFIPDESLKELTSKMLSPGKDPAVVGRDLLARLIWWQAALLLGLSWCVGMVVMAHVIWHPLSGVSRQQVLRLVVTMLLVAVPLALAAVLHSVWPGAGLTSFSPPVMARLFEETFQRSNLECMPWVINFANALAYIGIVSLVAATCSTLHIPKSAADYSPQFLASQMHRLSVLLYCASAFLVAGVLEIGSLFHWPIALFPDEIVPHIRRIAVASTLAFGSFYTVLIASIYFPAAAILAIRAHRMVSENDGDTIESQGKWLVAQGLSTSTTQRVGHVLAVLAPVAASGPVNALIQTFIKS